MRPPSLDVEVADHGADASCPASERLLGELELQPLIHLGDGGCAGLVDLHAPAAGIDGVVIEVYRSSRPGWSDHGVGVGIGVAPLVVPGQLAVLPFTRKSS